MDYNMHFLFQALKPTLTEYLVLKGKNSIHASTINLQPIPFLLK